MVVVVAVAVAAVFSFVVAVSHCRHDYKQQEAVSDSCVRDTQENDALIQDRRIPHLTAAARFSLSSTETVLDVEVAFGFAFALTDC